MARSKLLTAAALSSAIVLASCAGKTVSDDTSATSTATSPESTTTVETLVLETDDDVALNLEIEQVEPDTLIEESDEMNMDLVGDLVFFDYDKADIRAEFREMLNTRAAYLVANPNIEVVLEGHADERGTREYNLALGERRAKQVATYLQVKGVSAGQIDVVSYGEEMPLALGKSESDYAQNRRVKFK
ncbi:MAG: peptidoglycan-associated lipoprotein Pal [Reinekea forsetii]|jgi:peptidoglycan-associated lipoprotein|uniref:Peptidoglycan-associated lipoprotein n=1 Tax=Reinekea forsetii TaxID=1336806 RepID=A0A2K8KMY5_9GAMM|nr:peptidoglycan-associated lipoprotein Pal [Reinekea forsetii]ATX76185.1 18K peptidoglycan-associated outer membrane lipoprotein [Reinekea forsetii]MDB9894490.1 peptidoglycan-associated lipoprotein Pal [Reinekea forsetii]MDO7646022.1 peptidoglycan-associated lipoprotein Pal [Reinekea forsetii]MDO7674094.1 peptidoglycan-associated lipoprotein Pal [Reinekea forsetii]